MNWNYVIKNDLVEIELKKYKALTEYTEGMFLFYYSLLNKALASS